MEKQAKIYIAGHKGLVGSAICKNLMNKGYTNLILKTSSELDLRNQLEVSDFFKLEKPEYVILAAAKVGGIIANNVYRADFIYENLQIQNNVIHHSYLNGVKKLLFLGSTCIYPKEAPQPILEDSMLTSPLEFTNEPYAIAKIAGIKMCEAYNMQYGTNFVSVMPTNLYGPNDNFNLEKSHVLPALIRKIHLGMCLEKENWNAVSEDLNRYPIEGVDGSASKQVIFDKLSKYGIVKQGTEVRIEIWGTGLPRREFLWSEDMADACIFVLENVDFKALMLDKSEIRNTHINVGTGVDITISDLAFIIKERVGFKGELFFNTSKPDGTMQKLTDVQKLHNLGWHHTVKLTDGIEKMYDWYLSYGAV